MSPENNIKKNVLEKIRTGSVPMRPHAFFTMRTAFIGLAAILVLAGSFFVLSFIFFSVQKSGIRYLLEFSERGAATFITLFPWTFLLIALALFIIIEGLLRSFSFGYRSSLLRIFLLVTITGVIGGQLLSLTPLHTLLLSAADNDQLPLLGSLYKQLHDSHNDQGVYRGHITNITGSSFVISHDDADKDTDDGTWNIIPPAGYDLSRLSIGEPIYIAGRAYGNIVYAYGIHRISGE